MLVEQNIEVIKPKISSCKKRPAAAKETVLKRPAASIENKNPHEEPDSTAAGSRKKLKKKKSEKPEDPPEALTKLIAGPPLLDSMQHIERAESQLEEVESQHDEQCAD